MAGFAIAVVAWTGILVWIAIAVLALVGIYYAIWNGVCTAVVVWRCHQAGVVKPDVTAWGYVRLWQRFLTWADHAVYFRDGRVVYWPTEEGRKLRAEDNEEADF